MNPLAQFVLKFKVDGLQESSQQLDSFLDKLGGYEQGAGKGGQRISNASKGLDGIVAGAKKLVPYLGAAAAAAKIYKSAVDVREQAISMQNLATAAGVGADKLEGMGRALRQFNGDWRTAGGLYGRITDMMTGLYWGQLDKSDLISKYGVDIVNSLQNRDYEGVLRGISDAMSRQGFTGFKREISQGFLGGDEALQLFFSQDWPTVSQQLREAGEKNFLSSNDIQRSSREFLEASKNFKEAWERAAANMLPALASITNSLQPLVEGLEPLLNGLGSIFESLSPLINPIAKVIGAGWEGLGSGISNLIAFIKGEKTGSEVIDSLSQTTAGQWGADIWESIEEQKIKNSLSNLTSGQYNKRDVSVITSWLESPELADKWNTPEWLEAMELVKTARANLPPEPRYQWVTTESPGNINIELVEINDATGTLQGKADDVKRAIELAITQSDQIIPSVTTTMDSF